MKRFIPGYFALKKLRRQLGFFSHRGWREQISIAQLVLALDKVLHLDPTLFHQSLKTEVDTAQSNTQILGQRTLTDLRRLMQTAQDFKLDFLLETSQFLKWGYEAQGDLGTLPPCRFTISKRGQRILARRPEKKSTAKDAAASSMDERNSARLS